MHTKGQVKIDDATDLPLAIIEDTENGVGLCEIGASDSTKEMASSQEKDNARRIVALWNMADRLNLSTEFIENDGVDTVINVLSAIIAGHNADLLGKSNIEMVRNILSKIGR